MSPARNLVHLLLAVAAAGAIAAAEPEAEPKKPASPLDRFSPEQRRQLLAGEPVYESKKTSEDGQGHGQAFIIVNAPIETCFAIFSQLDRQREYFPRKTKSEVVKQEGDAVWLSNQFDFYVATVEYTSRYVIDPENHRFDFALDPAYPHNLKESTGYFIFESIDPDHTLFTYAATRLDTGVKVPQAVQKFITARDLPAQAVNVKKRIESGGKWTDDEQ